MLSFQSFSPRFVVLHTFAGANPKKEVLLFKVLSFDQRREAGPPLRTDPLLLENVYAARKEPLTLRMREKVTMKTSSLAVLAWESPDARFPPECDQFLQWTDRSRPNNKLVNLVSGRAGCNGWVEEGKN